MPKTPRYRQHQNYNYYGNDGYGRNGNWAYNNRNHNNYNSRYNEDYGAGYHNSYKNRWQTTHDAEEGSYRRNWNKNWKGRQNSKQKNYKGQNRQTAGENKNNTSKQSSNVGANKLLAALDKTAESMTNSNAKNVSVNKNTRPTTEVQTVEKGQSKTAVLKEENQNETEMSPKQLRQQKFQQYLNDAKEFYHNSAKNLETPKKDICDVNQPKIVPAEVPPVAGPSIERPSTTGDGNENIAIHSEEMPTIQFKSMIFYEICKQVENKLEYAPKAEQHQERNSYTATTIQVIYDEVTQRETQVQRALQAKVREELIKKTKETRLYKVYKERTREAEPGVNVFKTPDISIAASRWKETHFKPWRLELAQRGHHLLDGVDEEDDADIEGQ